MTRCAVGIATLTVALATASPHARPQAPAPAQSSARIQADTTAILVDVTVRDKRGQPVTDLTAADFEVYEDGVIQEIGSFTVYTPDAAPARREAPAPPAAPAAGGELPRKVEPPPPAVIALVFDRLTPEARAFANKAALAYVGQNERSDSLIGVFGIDLSLITYQGYTRDTSRLRRAIADVGARSTAQFESQAGAARAAGERAAAGGLGALSAGGQAAGQAAQAAGGAAPDAIFADMQRRTLETFEVLERDQQGHTTSNGLLAVVNSLRALAGRKSVIFFSEGVAIPANVAARFRSVIDTANRANVSIYAMDAAGLRTESTSQETRDNMMAAAERMLRRNPTADVAGAPMTAALERNEDLLRHDPHSGLGQLADETGGVLIRSTNDLTGGFLRIDQDMQHYYMLSYVPRNDRFDGKFRTIAVNVKRPGLDVAARKGYYAVRAAGPVPVMSFEAPALALLEATPVPNAFPMRASAVTFPERDRIGLTTVLVTVPASALTFRPAEDGTSYRGDFSVVVRFRNEQNEVTGKLSQNYVLTGPIDRLDAVKQGNILFYREPELDPGVYTMEAIVHDALGDRASARLSTLERPPLEEQALRMSDLVLVARAERLAEADRPPGNPFLVGDTLLYPNMGEPLRKSATREIGFFFTVYPEGRTPPRARLELLQNGAALAQVELPLSGGDASGRIQQVSRLPLDALPPGTYDLRVVVSQDRQQVSKSVTVRILD